MILFTSIISVGFINKEYVLIGVMNVVLGSMDK